MAQGVVGDESLDDAITRVLAELGIEVDGLLEVDPLEGIIEGVIVDE